MSEQGCFSTKTSYTYIAIPLDAFQSGTEQNIHSFSVPPSLLNGYSNDNEEVVLPAVNGNIPIGNVDKNSFVRICNTNSSEKMAVILRNTLNNITQNSTSTINKTIILKSHPNTSEKLDNKKSSIYKCGLCKEIFKMKNEFKKHMEEHFKNKFKCEYCEAFYYSEENLRVHLILHNKGEPYCSICNKRFLRSASLKSHLKNHQMSEIFNCSECDSHFDNEGDFVLHDEAHHQETQIQYPKTSVDMSVCPHCTRTFSNPNELKEHVFHHIAMKKLIRRGKRIKKPFPKISAKRNRHTCYVCEKSFSKYCFLERHMRIHTGEKPFVCHVCKRAFNQKGTLQMHLLRHTGIKPYTCALCSAKFFQKCNLQVHIQKTHMLPAPNQANQTIYKCEFCTCIFGHTAALSAHNTKMHGRRQHDNEIANVMEQLKDLENQLGLQNTQASLDPDAIAPRNDSMDNKGNLTLSINTIKLYDYSSAGSTQVYNVRQRKYGQFLLYGCTYCNKEFKKSSDLLRHIRIHTKLKPFQCQHCDKTFAVKSTLINHLNIHYKLENFRCEICLRSFASGKLLNYHMKKFEKVILSNGNEYVCNICNTTLNSVQEVKHHMGEHNINHRIRQDTELNKLAAMDIIMQPPMLETDEGLFPVPSSKSSTNYNEEELLKRKHRCSQCKAAFVKLIHLKRHLLIHSQDRKHLCNFCSKSFYTSYALKEHLKFHSGQRNYKCMHCTKSFATSGILKRHRMVHSQHKPYLCPYCKMRFKTTADCRKHINIHKRDVDLQVSAPDKNSDSDNLFTNQLSIQKPVSNETYIAIPSQQYSNVDIVTNTQLTTIGDSCLATTPSTKMLFTDQNGIIVSAVIDNEVIQSDGFLESTTVTPGYNAQVIVRDIGTLINQPSIIQANSEDGYTAIYINYQDLQVLSDSTQYGTHFTEQNPDPLLLDSENANIIIADSSILSTANESFSVASNFEDAESNFVEGSILPNDAAINSEPTEIESDTQLENNSLMEETGMAEDLTSENVILSTWETVDLSNSTLLNAVDEHTHYICTQCHESFDVMKDLTEHSCNIPSRKGKVSKDEVVFIDGKYKCNTCGKSFAASTVFKKHKQAHSMEGQLKVCTYCQRVFKKPNDLVRHIRIHTGEKPFKCDKCEKSFSLKSTLTSHYRTHDPTKKEYSCLVCGASFGFNSSLKVHFRIHTGVKPFKCTVCPEVFRTSGHKKAHMVTHTKPQESRKPRFKKTKLHDILASVGMDSQSDNHLEDVNQLMDVQGLSKHGSSLQLLTDASNTDVLLTISNQSHDGTEPLLLHLNNVLLQTRIDELPSYVQADGVTEDAFNTQQAFNATEDTVQDFIPIEALVQEDPVHQVNKNVPKVHECDICHKTYSRKYVLNKHKKTHLLKCKYCCVILDSKENFANHSKLHCTRTFPCHLCANVFQLEKNLKVHMKRIHNTTLD